MPLAVGGAWQWQEHSSRKRGAPADAASTVGGGGGERQPGVGDHLQALLAVVAVASGDC